MLFKGFAGAKNYLILKSFENKSFYWTFIHDFKISNIVLFEDKSDEEKVSCKELIVKIFKIL